MKETAAQLAGSFWPCFDRCQRPKHERARRAERASRDRRDRITERLLQYHTTRFAGDWRRRRPSSWWRSRRRSTSLCTRSSSPSPRLRCPSRSSTQTPYTLGACTLSLCSTLRYATAALRAHADAVECPLLGSASTIPPPRAHAWRRTAAAIACSCVPTFSRCGIPPLR